MERKYPRVACDQVAELELRHERKDGRLGRVIVPARMRSLAPEGLGFELQSPWGLLVRRDDAVISRFDLHGNVMEIPGRVVWCTSGRAGVALQLGAVPEDRRREFVDWAIAAVTPADKPH